MSAEFEPETPAEGATREGLRKALSEGAASGFQKRLRASFVSGDFSANPGSRGSGDGRNPAAAGAPASSPGSDAPGDPNRSTANPPSPLAQSTPAGGNAQQPRDGRTPSELRLAAILHPGPAPEALRSQTRAAFLDGGAAADLAPLERRALREALEAPAARPGFARDLRSEFLSGATATAEQPAPEETAPAEAKGGKILRDPRLTARWAITALAAAAALLLLIGPFGGSGDGWQVRDSAQLGELATFSGRPFSSSKIPANGNCEFCPGKDTVLTYQDTVHLGLDGATAAVLDRPREGEMLGMRFGTPTGEANLVAFEGAQPTRISTGQVEVVVAEGATSVRYRKEGTCVVVVDGEAQVSLLAGLEADGQRTWTVTTGQRLTVDVDGNVMLYEDFTEQCEVDPHAAERLEDMHSLQQSLARGEAL